MKKKIGIGLAVLIVLAGALMMWFKSYTKSHSPVSEVTYSRNGTEVKVVYCQPFKKGRLIFGEAADKALQPYGAYWRVGANEATTFETNKDLKINGQELKAGKYQLYAVPGKETWQIAFNSEWDRWGANEADPKTDVLKTEVKAENGVPLSEQLKINFENADSAQSLMVIHWDQTRVRVPLESK